MIVIGFIIIIAGVIMVAGVLHHDNKPYIEQDIHIESSHCKLETYVWYKGEIIWHAFDPCANLAEDLVTTRYFQAEQKVKAIKALNKGPQRVRQSWIKPKEEQK
jgi:hypothetical protein